MGRVIEQQHNVSVYTEQQHSVSVDIEQQRSVGRYRTRQLGGQAQMSWGISRQFRAEKLIKPGRLEHPAAPQNDSDTQRSFLYHQLLDVPAVD